MKFKQFLCALSAAAMIFSASACSSGSQSSESSPKETQPAVVTETPETEVSTVTDENVENEDETSTVTDHAGYTVEVPRNIERIVVCDIYPLPSVLSVFFDSADKIVGMAGPSMTAAKNSLLSELYPEILNAQTGFIDGTKVNIEELMTLNPDVVFYSADDTALGDQLRNAGLCTIAISANKWEYNAIETLNNWIDLLDQMFPENNKFDKVKKYSGDTYKMVQDKIKILPDSDREKAFFLFKYSDTNITTSGKQFFGQWWADSIGSVNVGESLETDNSTTVSMEQIYQWNPSVIFITNFNTAQPDDLYNNTTGSFDWSGIDAVKNKRVYKMPLGIYRSYTAGADTPITLIWLAKTTYPELFEDIDITEKTKDYYKEVFGITLTDEQAEKIFAPVSGASAF